MSSSSPRAAATRPLLGGSLLAATLATGCVADTFELSTAAAAAPGGDLSATRGLVVVPTRIDFGVVDPACPPVRRGGAVVNGDQAAARVEAVSLLGDDGAFVLELPRLPRVLERGARLEWAVVADPAGLGPREATVVFEIRVSGDRLLTVERPVRLRADDAPMRTDRFVQNQRRATDVLFVIDDSSSMAPEQEALGRNFVTFLEAANRGLSDYQIGVTTTDMSEDGERGRLVPTLSPDDPAGGRTEHIVTRASLPNPVEAFRRNALVGIRGTRDERGLDAARAALSEPLISRDNLGFLRPEASLALVFVSDEDDASDAPVADFARYFSALKGDDPSRVSASAIVGPSPEGCDGATGGAGPGTRYLGLVRRLGGRSASICTGDWGRALAEISGVAFGLEGRFVLAAPPSGEPTVTVNGNPRPRVNAVGQETWSLDPSTRTLTFGAGFTPPEGAVVEIRYPVGCPTDDGES